MDIKDRRHRSLTRGRCGKECRYTSSSLDSEDCRVPTQKSYSSSETLKAYDHDTRMHYGNRVSDLVHRESDEFPRQGTNFTLAELGICEPSPHRSGYCSDIGILHQGYSLSTGSDADSDTEGGMSPEHAIRLWGRGIKSRRSSGLSSRENSALTLTDSDNDNKSDEENDMGTIADSTRAAFAPCGDSSRKRCLGSAVNNAPPWGQGAAQPLGGGSPGIALHPVSFALVLYGKREVEGYTCIEQEGVYSTNMRRNQRLSSTASIWVICKGQATGKDDFYCSSASSFKRIMVYQCYYGCIIFAEHPTEILAELYKMSVSPCFSEVLAGSRALFLQRYELSVATCVQPGGSKYIWGKFVAEENPSVAVKRETPLLAPAVPELQGAGGCERAGAIAVLTPVETRNQGGWTLRLN
ncbi:PREDICTED: uncharacterized protein LOC104487807 [Chlamydotis macqueenii]|uniref:uncharacterized protein LOC104487807 n=1 Tax=Chlamydotis macqueenii TaxID=187382 RepID=UPI00052986F6|nr:PREDICTED: uncharacterized protein LOC104487807 [Chlamydotis macqueenii]